MTNEEMKELDKWLAENVMEYYTHYRKYLNKRNRFIYWVKDWRPTRDIAQAFEVVKMLRKRKLFLSLEAGDDATPDNWWCYIADEEAGRSVEAETPALAICLATKKAWKGMQ